jgi:2-hydroxychromene-2-carboxylate isomerase
MTVPGLLRRRVLPSTIIALSQVDAPARVAAALRRATGRPARVELYLAFDDPCSAVALLDLSARLAPHDVELVTRPVMRRGIPGDPAVEDKRRYALADARRLARRAGLTLARAETLEPSQVAHLALSAAALPEPARADFCRSSMRRLWLQAGRPDSPAAGAGADEGALRANERRMRRAGPYETPAAVVHGQWFFAHDRGPQIERRVIDLGFGGAA